MRLSKGIIADFFTACNNYSFKTIIPNKPDCHGGNRCLFNETTTESILPDACYTIRNSDRYQRTAITECTLAINNDVL